MSEDRQIDPPDPNIVIQLLQERAANDPGLALILEAAQWKALYLTATTDSDTPSPTH